MSIGWRVVAVGLMAMGGMTAQVFAGHTSSDGTSRGWPLVPPDVPKIQAAINDLRASGRGRVADHLQKLLNSGNICRECNAKDACANSNGGGDSTPFGGSINVVPDYINGSTEFLASVLLHEETHLTISGLSPAAEECTCQWQEYNYGKAKKAALPQGQAKAEICANLDAILKWYPNFPNWTGPGAPPPPAYELINDACRSAIYQNGNNKASRTDIDGTATIFISYWDTGTGAYATTTLESGITKTLSMKGYVLPSGKFMVVVIGTDGTETQGTIKTFVDTDGDAIVDTAATVAGSGSGLVRPTGITVVDRVGAPAQWFALDPTEGKVWRLADSNTDEQPDGIGNVYATTTLCPDIANSVALFRTGTIGEDGSAGGDTFVALNSTAATDDKFRDNEWTIRLTDSNSDGVADSATGRRYNIDDDIFTPELRLGGCVGDLSMTVYGPKGHVVQTLSWNDTTSQYDILRGSGTVGSNKLVTYGISPALGMGQTFILKDANTGNSTPPFAVGTQVAKMSSVVPTFGPTTGGTTVVISGRHFPSNPEVYFGDVAGTVVNWSDTEITATTPNIGADNRVVLEISVRKNGDTFAREWFFTFK